MNVNNILSLSTALKDNQFPFWTDCNGTFGSLVYSALKKKNFDPKSIDIDCRNRKLTYKGKTRTIKNCSVNGILKMLKLN